MKPGCFSFVVALVAIGLVLAFRPAPAPAEEPSAPPDLRPAVKRIVTDLLTRKDGLRVGMPLGEIRKAMPAAAFMLGSFDAPLAGSGYDPGESAWGGLDGVVECFAPGDADRLGTIRVLLLVPAYDRKAMAESVLGTGRSHGLDVDVDDDEPNLYWGCGGIGRDLWVALGERVIAIEVSVDEPEKDD